MSGLAAVKALTFDLFGTILDLAGSLRGPIAEFLTAKSCDADPQQFWQQWRARQRIEQYQDNILLLGHSGYLTVARRACVYTLGLNGIHASQVEIDGLMQSWQELSPFPDVLPALPRLAERFQLVALSNGEPEFLQHLVQNRIGWDFDAVISVQRVGAFKPSPAVYRHAASALKLEVGECLMVSANSFDVMGARACGFRGVFVNRLQLPYEETQFQPDITVTDFTQLADALLA